MRSPMALALICPLIGFLTLSILVVMVASMSEQYSNERSVLTNAQFCMVRWST